MKLFKKIAFTLIEIMLVAAIIITLAALALPNFLRVRINTNEVLAQKALKEISRAAESYLFSNGRCPEIAEQLLTANPPHLNKKYCNEKINGYFYECTFNTNNYALRAKPVDCITAGNHSYRIGSDGNIITDDKCEPANVITAAPIGIPDKPSSDNPEKPPSDNPEKPPSDNSGTAFYSDGP